MTTTIPSVETSPVGVVAEAPPARALPGIIGTLLAAAAAVLAMIGGASVGTADA